MFKKILIQILDLKKQQHSFSQFQSYIHICKLSFLRLPPRAAAHGRHQTLSLRHVCSLRENDTRCDRILAPTRGGIDWPRFPSSITQNKSSLKQRGKIKKKGNGKENKTKAAEGEKQCHVNKWYKHGASGTEPVYRCPIDAGAQHAV